MIKNYLKVAIRILVRNKVFSIINIAGLATGLAACLIILLYIQYEWSFDRHNKNENRIFRVTEHIQSVSGENNYATSPEPLASVIASEFAQVKHAARIVQMSHYVSVYEKVLVSLQWKAVYEENLYFADPSLFKVLTIPLLRGNAAKGLERPFTIFISSSIAGKYFGKKNPIGATIKIGGGQQDYEVSGVFEDFPSNAHIHPEFLASYATIESGSRSIGWHPSVYTYVLLKNRSDESAIEKQMATIVDKYVHPSGNEKVSFTLMPLSDIHLHSRLRFEAEPQGDIRYVYLFSGIALLILIIACFNYVNMATARSAKRALETGVRKAMGATRTQLVKQYFLESFLLNLIALILAILLTNLFLPYFNHLTQLNISFGIVDSIWILGLIAIVLVGVSLLSGLYPACMLSSFRPVVVLKGKVTPVSGVGLRKALVVFQFSISVILIICAMILQMQMNFIQNHQPGSQKDRLILISNRGSLIDKYYSFKSELLQNPQVSNVTTTQFVPGFTKDSRNFDATDIEGYHEKVSDMPVFYGDEDFINTLGLKLKKGRNFSNEYPSDKEQSILVNEAAVKLFGWSNPIGKYMVFKEANFDNGKMTFHRQRRRVVGVVKNFHYESLKKMVTPVIIQYDDGPYVNIVVKVRDDNIAQTLSFIKREWNSFVPDKPLDYSFFNEEYAAMYRTDYLLGSIFKDFAVLAIIIACLGLFGLASFSTEQRTKEIGIRKVMGASVNNILGLLTGEFLILVFIGIIIAIPIAWWAMQHWLQSYSYRTGMEWWVFALAGLLSVFIALITVSFQAIKAAIANPVESLRSE